MGLSLDRTSRLFVKEAKYDGGLDVAGRNDYAGKSSPHGHAFLLINKQRVLLDLEILFHSFDLFQHIGMSGSGLVKFVFKLFYAGRDNFDLLDQIVIGLVGAVLHFWPLASLL